MTAPQPEQTPARLEFVTAERAAANAAAFHLGARSVWDAAHADARTHDVAVDPTSRIAQAYRRALDNAADADLRRDRAADALAAENAADRARRTAQLEQAEHCVCSGAPDGLCLGVPGESDACGECLTLDPELPCLSDPIMARAEALQALHDAALPADAPGAWIRAAIEAEQLHDDTLNASAAALADEAECAAACTDEDRSGAWQRTQPGYQPQTATDEAEA